MLLLKKKRSCFRVLKKGAPGDFRDIGLQENFEDPCRRFYDIGFTLRIPTLRLEHAQACSFRGLDFHHIRFRAEDRLRYFVSNIVTPMLMIAFMGACSTVIPYHNMGERLGVSQSKDYR